MKEAESRKDFDKGERRGKERDCCLLLCGVVSVSILSYAAGVEGDQKRTLAMVVACDGSTNLLFPL